VIGAVCRRRHIQETLYLLPPHVAEAAANVAITIVVYRHDGVYCGLCGKGPFTRRGYCLHASRLHTMEIQRLILEESARISASSRS
ncbi:MAG: hypothetical protein GSR78_00615, partial [Desulfurococcales archaeon]|nr:hypothetical protein [Desulfurococcales archaeon]